MRRQRTEHVGKVRRIRSRYKACKYGAGMRKAARQYEGKQVEGIHFIEVTGQAQGTETMAIAGFP